MLWRLFWKQFKCLSRDFKLNVQRFSKYDPRLNDIMKFDEQEKIVWYVQVNFQVSPHCEQPYKIKQNDLSIKSGLRCECINSYLFTYSVINNIYTHIYWCVSDCIRKLCNCSKINAHKCQCVISLCVLLVALCHSNQIICSCKICFLAPDACDIH